MSTNVDDLNVAPDISEETLSRRYSRRFPGYRLATYGRVAIPIFRLRVRVLKIIRKPLPAIQEFILRVIDTGLTHAADIAGFLGLERNVVNGVLSELATKEHILLGGGNEDKSHRLILTEQGKGALNSSTLETVEQETQVVYLDGLTRRLVDEADLKFLRPIEVRKAGLTELPPYPRTRPEIEEFRDQMFADWKQKNEHFDLIAVLAIERVEPIFRDDVLLLSFRADEGQEGINCATEIGFVVGGHWSDIHAEVFRRSNAESRIPLLPEKTFSNSGQLGLPQPEIVSLIAPVADTTSLRDQVVRADERIRRIEELLEATSSVSERGTFLEQLRQEQSRRAEAEARLSSIPIRQLEVNEHSPLLNDALANAQERIMIISPWLRRTVVNKRFLKKLATALDRGVTIYIGFGITKGDDASHDREALDGLERLEGRYENLILKELGNTHAKVLVCDRRYLVVTSFNWLSFRGDPRDNFRDERGIYVAVDTRIEETFTSYLSMFRE